MKKFKLHDVVVFCWKHELIIGYIVKSGFLHECSIELIEQLEDGKIVTHNIDDSEDVYLTKIGTL